VKLELNGGPADGLLLTAKDDDGVHEERFLKEGGGFNCRLYGADYSTGYITQADKRYMMAEDIPVPLYVEHTTEEEEE